MDDIELPDTPQVVKIDTAHSEVIAFGFSTRELSAIEASGERQAPHQATTGAKTCSAQTTNLGPFP